MPRRAVITRRPIDPDPVYNSALVTQLVNKVLKDGKKSTSEGVVYGALERIRDRTGRDPVAVMEEAVRNVTPALEVKSPPRRRRDVPGADRGPGPARAHARDPVARALSPESGARSR